MPERAVRFAVKDESSGSRSSTWKCWTTVGTGKSDIYLTNRAIGRAFKASFHESGAWHVAFDKQFLEREADDDSNGSKNRFIDTWFRPQQIGHGITLAYRIVIPRSAANIPLTGGLRREVSWIPAPPPKKATEISILITEPGAVVTGWPGRRSMQTLLVGTILIENNSTVWIVHKQEDIPAPASLIINPGNITHFRSGMDVALSEPGVRIIGIGIAKDGSHFMMEWAAKISKDAEKKLRQRNPNSLQACVD